MTDKNINPGISDSDLAHLEHKALEAEAQEPGLADETRDHLLAQSEQVLLNAPFIATRDNLMANRPRLELPYPAQGESFSDYYQRIVTLVDKYDESKGE